MAEFQPRHDHDFRKRARTFAALVLADFEIDETDLVSAAARVEQMMSAYRRVDESARLRDTTLAPLDLAELLLDAVRAADRWLGDLAPEDVALRDSIHAVRVEMRHSAAIASLLPALPTLKAEAEPATPSPIERDADGNCVRCEGAGYLPSGKKCPCGA